jgi:hypothetical protein
MYSQATRTFVYNVETFLHLMELYVDRLLRRRVFRARRLQSAVLETC